MKKINDLIEEERFNKEIMDIGFKIADEVALILAKNIMENKSMANVKEGSVNKIANLIPNVVSIALINGAFIFSQPSTEFGKQMLIRILDQMKNMIEKNLEQFSPEERETSDPISAATYVRIGRDKIEREYKTKKGE